MPKEEKNWMCYWQSDASPVPQLRVVKENVTQKQAEKWLSKQEHDVHWIPKIGQVTVTPVALEEVTVETPVIETEEVEVDKTE